MKFQSNHFLVVLIENHKKWTEKNVDMFLVQNQVILAWFSTLPTLVVSLPKSVNKIYPEVFLALFYVKKAQIDPKRLFLEVLGVKLNHFGLVCRFR